MKNKKILLSAILFGLLFGSINILFNPAPCDDAVRYYIPMARAFGAGDYIHAFHHTIPPLVPVLGGVLSALGLSAWTAIKTVSVLAWILAVFPLYRIARRILNSDIYAQWCCLGYILLLEIMRCAFTGTLEPMKTLLLFWVVDRLMSCTEKGRFRDVVYAGIGVALLGLVRNECIAFVLPVLVFVLLLKRYPVWKRIFSAATVLGVCLILWFPFAALIQKEFGVPALTSKQVKAVQRLISLTRGSGVQPVAQKSAPYAKSMEWKPPVQESENSSGIPSSKYLSVRIENTLRGGLPVLMPFWIYGIFLRLNRKEWSRNDTFCLVFFGYNALIFWVFVNYTVARYIEAAAPLLLPWALLGLVEAGRAVSARVSAVKRISRRWIFATLTAWIAGFGIKGLSGVRHYFKGDYDTRMEVGRWIENNASDLDVNETPEPDRGFGRTDYSSGCRLSVAAYAPGYSLWAGSDFISMRWRYSPPPEICLHYLKSLGADLLIADENTRKYNRTTMKQIHRLQMLKEFPEYKVKIYSLDLKRLEPEPSGE